MRVGLDTLPAIQNKLRMMDIMIFGPTYICGDNISDIHNASKPESTLKKKCNEIAYWSESLLGHLKSEDDSADLVTKLMTGQKKKLLLSFISCDMYDT